MIGPQCKTCYYCGRENEQTAEYCRECGTILGDSKTQQYGDLLSDTKALQNAGNDWHQPPQRITLFLSSFPSLIMLMLWICTFNWPRLIDVKFLSPIYFILFIGSILSFLFVVIRCWVAAKTTAVGIALCLGCATMIANFLGVLFLIGLGLRGLRG